MELGTGNSGSVLASAAPRLSDVAESLMESGAGTSNAIVVAAIDSESQLEVAHGKFFLARSFINMAS